MRTANRFLVVAVIAVFGAVPMASSQVQGKATTYTSPNGVIERCVAIAPIPGGTYSEHDGNEEGRLCAIDLYAPSVAMCPKTWSTSPGTLIYDISSGDFANDPVRFERDACPKGGSAIKEAVGELAKHKQSINTVDSSATLSTASLLYYHLSRYFETTVNVPVSVYRSIDKDAHLKRVTEAGFRPCFDNTRQGLSISREIA